MFPTRLMFDSRMLSGTILALTLVMAGIALAECPPDQMQEANLAYHSAAQYLTNQQWDQAINRLQSIVTVCPEHVEATRGLGTAFVGKKDYAKATEFFTRVVKLRADLVEAGDYANLAKAYAKQKQYKEARAEYMKAEMLAPEDCGVLYNLGAMHFASGFYSQSVDVLERALDQCSQYEEPILKQLTKSANAAADQQRSQGNNTKATFYADLANQYGGAAGGSTTYKMVKQEMGRGNYAQAITLLEQMLEQNPDQANAVLTLARAQDAAGDNAASVKAYRRYLELKPNDTNEIGTMLQVMVEGGRCADAKSEAATAYAEHAGQGRQAVAPILFSWGMALECTEDYDEAKGKFAECAASGHKKYAGPAQTYVGRMDDLMAHADHNRKQARQGG